MKNKKTSFAIVLIVLIAICLSLSLGMLDHETESLHHLLTSDKGNLITLTIFASFFSTVGIGFLFLIKSLRKAMKKKVS